MTASKRSASPYFQQCSKRAKTASSKKTGFLDLPGELRNQIYELSLVTRKRINILCFASLTGFRRPEQKLRLSSALLRTCKQVQDEGEKVLYGLNTFTITVSTRPSLVQACNRKEAELSRTLNSDVLCLTDRAKFENPKSKNIANLEIRMLPAKWREPAGTNDHLLEDICAAFLGPETKVDVLSLKFCESESKRCHRRLAQINPALIQAHCKMLELDREMSIDTIGIAAWPSKLDAIIVDAEYPEVSKYACERFAKRFRAANFNLVDTNVSQGGSGPEPLSS